VRSRSCSAGYPAPQRRVTPRLPGFPR
jgi:hypothetical protein